METTFAPFVLFTPPKKGRPVGGLPLLSFFPLCGYFEDISLLLLQFIAIKNQTYNF